MELLLDLIRIVNRQLIIVIFQNKILAFDKDHSNRIEFAEFLVAFNIKSKGKIEDKLSWTFDVYDRFDKKYDFFLN